MGRDYRPTAKTGQGELSALLTRPLESLRLSGAVRAPGRADFITFPAFAMYAYWLAGALVLTGMAGDGDTVARQNIPLDRDPQAMLDAAARRFRMQVYDTYRTDPEELKRRRAVADDVYARWRQAGSRPHEAAALIDWLNRAADSSRPDVRQPLPLLPALKSAGQGSVDRRELQRDRRGIAEDPRTSAPAQSGFPPVQAQARATSPAPPPNPTMARGPTVNARPTAKPMLLPAPWELTSPPQAALSLRPGVLQPRQTTAAPNNRRGIERPQRSPAAVDARPPAASGLPPFAPAEPPQTVDVRRKHNHHASDPALIARGQTAYGDAGPRKELPTVPRSRVETLDSPRPTGASPTAPRIALAKPQIEYSADDIRAILAGARNAAQRADEATDRLNVGELLARASGYSFGLRTIDGVLHDTAPLDTADLERLLGELEALIDQRRDLLLYEQLVGADTRQRLVRSLGDPQSTVAELGTRIAAARARLSEQPLEANADDLETLAELSRRLSRLSQD
jgi:hypothetical protein